MTFGITSYYIERYSNNVNNENIKPIKHVQNIDECAPFAFSILSLSTIPPNFDGKKCVSPIVIQHINIKLYN